MQCPHCATQLTAYATVCPACNTAFDPSTASRLALYIALQDEEAAFTAFNRDLARITDVLSRRRRALREALDKEQLQQPGGESQPAAFAAPLDLPPPATATAQVPPPGSTEPTAAPVEPPGPTTPPIPTSETPAAPPGANRLFAAGHTRPEATAAPRSPTPTFVPRTVLSELLVGQRWLLLLGVVAVLTGVGYFFKYSIERGWVSPILRVLSCYGGGSAFMLAGEKLRRRHYEKYGLYLTGLGIALFSFATYAGYGLYHLFGQAPAYAVMVLTTVLAMTLAIRYVSQGIAVLGLLVGYAVPFLLGSAGDDALRLPYLVLLSLGLTLVCTRQGWIPLRSLTVALAYAAFGQWFVFSPAKTSPWLAFSLVNMLAAIFLLVPFLFEYKREENAPVDVVSWLASPLCALTLSYLCVRNSWPPAATALVPLGYCAVFAGLASLMARQGRQESNRFVVLLAGAAVMLALVPPILLSLHWLTVAWAALALATAWIGLRLDDPRFLWSGVAGLGFVLAKYLLWDSPKALHRAALAGYAHSGERLLTEVLLLGTLPVLAAMLRRRGRRIVEPDTLTATLQITDLALCVLLWLGLTHECRLFFREYLPAALQAATSVLWTVYGAALLVAGFRNNRKSLRLAALGLLGVTWLKVFLVDTADFSTPYRILVLLLLGLILIALSFLYHKFKSRVLDGNANADR
jgi:uncharacterized membrane protein